MMSDLLQIENLSVTYGAGAPAVDKVAFDVAQGSVVALLGANGAGKSSIMKAISGLTPASGTVRFEGQDIAGQPARARVARGIVYVPEGREIVGDLTVRENLVLGGYQKSGPQRKQRMDMVLDLFPEIAEKVDRQAWRLSGGEQQMLAIGRALMTNPELLILDEATEGLAPLVRQKIWAALKDIRDAGLSIIVVDKNLHDLLRLADQNFIVERGRVVWSGSSDELRADETARGRYLGL